MICPSFGLADGFLEPLVGFPDRGCMGFLLLALFIFFFSFFFWCLRTGEVFRETVAASSAEGFCEFPACYYHG